MRTAQIKQRTMRVFAIVSPVVLTPPPDGVLFHHYDESEKDVRVGDTFDPATFSYKRPEVPNV